MLMRLHKCFVDSDVLNGKRNPSIW